MPRSARKESGIGIYHVMMRGINRQAIFDDDEDCRRFMDILADLPLQHDDEGVVTDVIDLAPNSECVALNIPLGQWHTVEVLESGTVIMEVKDGVYEPQVPEDILSL